MRMIWVAVAALTVTGCVSRVPDSGNSVYLEPLSPQARSDREAALQGRPLDPYVQPMSDGVQGTSEETLSNDTIYTGDPSVGAVSTAEAAAAYETVAPKEVPERPKDTGPSVAGFALSTTHPVGQSVYARSGGSAERASRACARYASDDLAQAAFLGAGGPQRDGQGVDPDGDGYACSWDPERFRQALQ